MFLRIVRSHVAPGALSQAQINSISQDVVAVIKPLPGCQHVYVASNADTGQAVTVSHWDTREHAHFDASKIADLIARLQQSGVQIEAPEIYDINAQS